MVASVDSKSIGFLFSLEVGWVMFQVMRWWLLGLWMVGLLANAAAQAAPPVPDPVSQLLQDRDYTAAVQSIERSADDQRWDQSYLLYLKGRALHLRKDYDQAIAAFDQLNEQFPDSPWAQQARFATGLSYARRGDFRSAEAAYRAEAEHLFSDERKQEIADIYLEYADLYFDPPNEEQEPNYAKALDFYQRALKVGPKEETRVRLELQLAQCQQELGEFQHAAARYRQFIDENEDHALVVEARFRLGETFLVSDNLASAREAWQDLLELHRGASSDLLPQAAFRMAETYQFPTPDDEEALSLGVAALRRFLERYPEHRLAPKAHLWIAQAYQHLGRFEESAAALKTLLADQRYTETEQIPDARNLLGHAYLRQSKFDEALETWRKFLTKHPTHKAWSIVQRDIVNTEWAKAMHRYQHKDFAGARSLFDAFLAEHPLDQRVAQIQYLLGEMQFDQEQWAAAITNWRRLVSKYPKTQQASRAQFMIARTLEEKLGKLEEALEEYRKLDWGKYASVAKRSITRLTSKALEIATERVFRSDETPQLRVKTRNIERLTLRVYTIDMETYFRKMHQTRGIEALDISLIDPDQTFEYEVPDYQPHQQHDALVDVSLPAVSSPADADAEEADPQPMPAAGVMIVTVNSETLEATTMVLRSDLDVIIKSSRDEAFIFAQNMRTGQPWPNARILLSDGSGVFGEGRTSEDGVFHEAFEQLRDCEDLRVFAIDGGHMASNLVGLSGTSAAQGLSDKGYIYTDRPAYRPDQTVYLRGVIRKVVGDTYTVVKDKSYHVQVFDSRNRLVFETDARLNQYGSFCTSFTLSPAARYGEYRVLVHDEDQESYQGGFVVQDYKLEPVRLEIDTERSVYYRGETIEGVVRASYYYGAPLVEREIRYGFEGDRQYTARADENGEVHFRLETRQFRESQAIVMRAELPERNLASRKNLYLSTQGFSLAAESARDVYLAGETFELEVTAADAEGNPIEQSLAVDVLRNTEIDGQAGLVSVQKLETETDEKGVARITLKIDEGGDHTVRISGIDRFDNTIEIQWDVHISDDQDTTRLRILADRHSYKVGDTATVRVHWREQPALALVTFQGAKILDYQLVQLKKGDNRLKLPMTVQLAPNFDLAVSVMTDTRPAAAPASEDIGRPKRFHESSSPFTVERDLNVSLEMTRVAGDGGGNAHKLQPGDEVQITVTATDPQGTPVAAELSLAMVEQALLNRFPKQIPSIEEYFRGVRRQSAVRTTSSVTFAYRPQTNRIDPRLLAETERLAVEKEEQQRLSELADNSAGDDPFGGPGAGDPFGGPSADPFGAPANANALPAESMGFESRMDDRAKGGYEYGGEYESGYGEAMGGYGGMGGGAAFGGGGFGGGMGDARRRNLPPNLRREAVDFQLDKAWLALNGTQRQDVRLGRKLREESVRRDDGARPDLPPHETGYWNPALVTDVDGKATLTFALPDRSTGWSLLAVGVTADTLAGEAQHDFAVRKDFFGQLKLAAAFADGDSAEIEASVHNNVLDEGEVDVALTVRIGERSTTERKKLEIVKTGTQDLTFAQTFSLPDDGIASGDSGAVAEFELIVSAGKYRDVVRRTVPILPYGMPVFSTAGGSAASDAAAVIEQPKGMPITKPKMQILVGPTVERSLLDAVLAPPTWCQYEAFRIASEGETAVADLMASLGLQKMLRVSRDATGPQAASLDARIRSAISLLVAAQAEDGGWGWADTISNPFHSARTLWALQLAKEAGYRVEDSVYNPAVNYVQTQLSKAAVTDYETKVVLLHALTVADHGDFPLANQLHRNRPALSTAALAYLALTFAQMERKQTAAELLSLLAERKWSEDVLGQPARQSATLAACAWNFSDAEIRAIYALAIETVTPTAASLKQQVDWLLANRTGHRWSPDKATGPAVLALSRWFGRSRFENSRYKLTVFVNDYEAAELELDAASPTAQIDVPNELLDSSRAKQNVRFQLTGRGQFTYQCVLGGFVSGDMLKSTTTDWRVERHYQPGQLELDGRTIPRGFSVAFTEASEQFRNEMSQLGVGQRGLIELEIRRNVPSSRLAPSEVPYLVVNEPLPAGVAVVEDSVKGDFERFEIGSDAITFFVGNRFDHTAISYQVHGYLPGKYRATSTLVRDAFRPDRMAVSKPRSLTVLADDADVDDEYRLTPDELYALGQRQFDKGNFVAAAQHLGPLFNDWKLRPESYRDTVRMLLDIHLRQGPSSAVVRYFEIIIEKFPELEISFDKLLDVADAYHEIGEYERSYLVFRATVEASFLRESRVAGFLESEGEFMRSIDVMSRLLREYPPEPYLASSTYALAQRVYAKAPEAASDAKLRDAEITRVDLVRDAWKRLDAFLMTYPEDPAADQASFSIANALLDLELYQRAIAACLRYAKRYPDSDFLDSYWYIIGYCQFARGEHDEALAMCRKVSEMKRKDKRSGRMVDSPNKWQAIYILGQIYHSLGQAAAAIEQYARVEDRFVDARQAIEYFARKDIQLPEVESFRPGQPVEVTLSYRNVPACDVTVYRIDLMKFSLLRGDLSDITRINLAGIRPYHQETIDLGDGRDYRDCETQLKLPLSDAGAYLVVCRAENLHTSGMVLLSPMQLEVQEEAESGRVRATVRDASNERYIADAHVKVLGTRNDDFVSGETDLRGVFVADGIRGRSMVIARADEAGYAFFRGQTEIGPPPAQPSAPEEGGEPSMDADAEDDSGLLEGLKGANEALQMEQQEQLQEVYDNSVDEGIGGGFGGGFF